MQPNTPAQPNAQAHKRRARRLSPTRGRMLRRLGELHRVAKFCAKYDWPLASPEGWARVLAEVCYYLPKTQIHPLRGNGFDVLTFRRITPKHVDISSETAGDALNALERIIKRKGSAYRPMTPATAGRLLNLTAEQRWACDVRTMEPIDETREERAAEVRERRLVRRANNRRRADEAEREKERARSRRSRAAKGAKPRAQSLSQTRPWEKDGISRRTWERRRAAKVAASRGTEPRNSTQVRPRNLTQIRPALSYQSEQYIEPGRVCDTVARGPEKMGARAERSLSSTAFWLALLSQSGAPPSNDTVPWPEIW
jgi:hypothetical protein